MSNGKYFFLTCQMLECCCFDGFHSFSRKFFTGQAMNCKEQRPSDYHLSHPYYLHLWTLDFYFYLMDNSLQPLEDHLLDKMLNFSLKFHSHSNLHDLISTNVMLWTPLAIGVHLKLVFVCLQGPV